MLLVRASLTLALAGLCGCYSVGYQPRRGLRELAVPVFANSTLRRGVEHQLTRDVRRELLETTPIQVVRRDEGVPELRGTISAIDEGVLVSGSAEEVLESSVRITMSFGVYRDEALWIGADGDGDGVPDGEFQLSTFAEFDTTRGESRDTATQEAVLDLAEMVVFQLSERTDDRFEPNDEPAAARELRLGQQVALKQRNPDWFRLTVPAGQVLHVGLYYSPQQPTAPSTQAYPGPLTIGAHDETGAPLSAGVERADEGRLLKVAAGEAARPVWIRVAGDDAGQDYTLWIWLKAAPPE